MALFPAPARTAISDAYPNPSNATARTGFGALWDYVTSLLGTTGAKADLLAAAKLLDAKSIYNLTLVPSVAANALTMKLTAADGVGPLSTSNSAIVGQRSSSLSSGAYNMRNITADITLVISSGSTLGHQSGITQYLYWYLIDSGGTQELAVSSKDFGEAGIASTTAEGGVGAADTFATMYSATARSNVPFRCIARTRDGQVTAGTWLLAPTVIEVVPFSTKSGDLPAGIGPLPFSGPVIPFGWIDCNQAPVSRTTYAELFAAIGTTWGVGDGSTTFGLPPTPGRTVIGDGTGSGLTARTLGQAAIGEENHALSIAELAVHSHTDTGHQHQETATSGSGAAAFTSGALQPTANGATTNGIPITAITGSSGTALLTAVGAANIANTGSGTAHNTMQPSLVTKMIISTGGQ